MYKLTFKWILDKRLLCKFNHFMIGEGFFINYDSHCHSYKNIFYEQRGEVILPQDKECITQFYISVILSGKNPYDLKNMDKGDTSYQF